MLQFSTKEDYVYGYFYSWIINVILIERFHEIPEGK